MQQFLSDNSRVFTGRIEGESARKKLNLDKLDNQDIVLEIIFPKQVLAINPSFFLGLFAPSIKCLGIDKFKEKYDFISPESVKEDIEEGIIKALKDYNI